MLIKKKYEEAKAYIEQPVHRIVFICCLVVAGMLILCADVAFVTAYQSEISTRDILMCAFLFNAVPFFGISLALLKIADAVYSMLPEDILYDAFLEDDTDDRPDTDTASLLDEPVTLQVRQLLIIMVAVTLTGMVIAFTWSYTSGFAEAVSIHLPRKTMYALDIICL